MKLALIIAIAMALACFTNASFRPPHYDQDDQEWGDERLGYGSYTIAEKGCFLTAITSMMAGDSISVDGDTPNPEMMNDWFKDHDEFSGGLLLFKSPEEFGYNYEGFEKSRSSIVNALDEGKRAILNVLGGRHWVLVTGTTNSGYTVMDPADSRKTEYDHDEIVKAAIYTPPRSSSQAISMAAPADAEETSFSPSASVSTSNGSFNPPLYLQGDARWGNKILGNGPATIHQQGCVLSSTASMLAGDGVRVNGRLPDPSTLNSYFKANGAFINGYSLKQDIIKDLGYTWEGYKQSKSDIVNYLKQGKRVILNVRNGAHWVLATGYNSQGYTVVDPGSSRKTSYTYGEVVKARVYTKEF